MAPSLEFSSSTSPSSPPWEVLVLVAEHLDPRSLATASCVCKSWSISMASDHLWEPIFTANFPSLFNLAVPSSSAASFRRLFGLGHTAAARRRSTPSKPTLSLSDLVFIISVVSTHKDDAFIRKKKEKSAPPQSISCVKYGSELVVAADPNGRFKFYVNLASDSGDAPLVGAGDEVKVVWNVVLGGWRGVFTMIECGGRVGFAPGVDGWFSEELPLAGCCPNTVSGGIVADLKLGLCGSGRNENEIDNGENIRVDKGENIRVESASVGMLSVVNWRYVSVEDGLMYLQHFLFNNLK
ncbi:probable F-box protein At5g04010 isoform X2 [Momordica charantia]|nr:probable F-box protein At5g04010 isoform X2 [Momordica charantia]